MQTDNYAANRAELRRKFALEMQRSRDLDEQRRQLLPSVEVVVENARQISAASSCARSFSVALVQALRQEREAFAGHNGNGQPEKIIAQAQAQGGEALGKLPAA